MSLEKVFDVEIDGKDYKLEMTNNAWIKFEVAMEKSPVTWAVETLTTAGQPQYQHMLLLLICQLEEHQPKLRVTANKLKKMISIQSMFVGMTEETLGDTLLKCLRAAYAEEDDLETISDDSLESGEPDPLDEKLPDGQT